MPLYIDNATLSCLLLALYGDATTSNSEKYFLTQLKQRINLQHATLIVRPPTTTDHGLLYTSGDEADVAVSALSAKETTYTSLYARDPLVNLPLNQFVTIDDMTPRAQLLKSSYYQLLLEPHGIYYIAGIDWSYQPGSRLSIRFVRTRQQGPFTEEEKAFFSLLIPHLQQSVAIGIQLRQLDNELKIYADSRSRRTIGMITLDKTSNVLQLNTAAEQYLHENDGLSLSRNRVNIDKSNLNEKLHQYIQEALQSRLNNVQENAGIAINALAVPRNSGKADYQLVIKPLPVDDLDASEITPYLAIFIKDPGQRLDISVRTLMKVYQLTISEASIAILLSEGYTSDRVAEELGIKKNTVRAHLRALFAKTGVTQQSMLVSLVLTSLASIQ